MPRFSEDEKRAIIDLKSENPNLNLKQISESFQQRSDNSSSGKIVDKQKIPEIEPDPEEVSKKEEEIHRKSLFLYVFILR